MWGCVEGAVMDMCVLCAAFYLKVSVCVSSESVFSTLESLAETVPNTIVSKALGFYKTLCRSIESTRSSLRELWRGEH